MKFTAMSKKQSIKSETYPFPLRKWMDKRDKEKALQELKEVEECKTGKITTF